MPQTDLAISEKRHAAEIRRVTWIGFVANIALSALKLILGWVFHSRALVADGFHSLSDCTTDVAILIGSHFWLKPPDKDHPYGHRRIETLVTLFIGLSMLTLTVLITWDAILSFQQGEYSRPGLWAAVGAVLSIVVKEILYQYTNRKGKQLNSSSLVANAWHHRSDAISSIPVLVTVVGAFFFPNWAFLDTIGALGVSVLLGRASFQIIWPCLQEITDASAPERISKQIRKITIETPGVEDFHELRTRNVGALIHADIHIVVDGQITVLEGHAIGDRVRDRILAQMDDVVDVLIHVDPYDDRQEYLDGQK